MTHKLSKSKILSGIQCPKRLWLEVHRPDLLEYDQSTLARMNSGHQVGELACIYLAPGGQYIGLENGFGHALEETGKLLDSDAPKPLYEATFAHDGVLVRSDIVIPTKSGLLVTEVKSSTSVKQYHLWDCAVQYMVINGLGRNVRGIQVATIDSSFVYPGDGDYQGLMRVEDVTDEVLKLQPEIHEWTRQCLDTLQGAIPEVDPGVHCTTPFGCPFSEICAPEDGPEFPLECLPRIRDHLLEQLRQEGFQDIRDIPEDRLQSSNHERVRRVTVSGRPELLPGAESTLGSLPYPRYFLDFETAQLAVPVWAGTRPYQQLPFQWSCHVEDAPGRIRHLEFIDLTGDSPLREFARSLIAACGQSGPIFVYGNFEARILRELMSMFPDLTAWLDGLVQRIVDVLPIVRQHYYHPHMYGSWSIKAVLPCLVPDLDYSRLDGVQDGGQAQEAYAEAVDPKTSSHRKKELQRNLSAYCKMDTLALVKIIKALSGNKKV